MKIIFISDTHGLHDKVIVPECDVLVHAGDLCNTGARFEVERVTAWLNDQPAKHVVAIAGNHDFALERKQADWLPNWGRINYLENSSVIIEGIKFYGSPITPTFMDWAFMAARGRDIQPYWERIPPDTNVLVTHGPPIGILDQSRPGFKENGEPNSVYLGCEDLAVRVCEIRPQAHVFGHIHGSYGRRDMNGTTYINASQVNEAYKVVNKPIEVNYEMLSGCIVES